MKAKRHAKILELISEYPINTQEELLSRLNESGFYVTQATVSRDIKELRLIKTQSPGGGYHYTTNQKDGSADMSFKFHVLFSESVKAIDFANNLVVIKCFTGMANAVCAALDSMHWKDLVGTIAGADTILIVMRDLASAENFVLQLNKLIGR